MNNSSQITPDYQKKMNLKPPRKPAPYKSFKQIMNEGTPMQGQFRTTKMTAQGFTPILQTVNENDRYSQTMDKESKYSSGMTYGMNKQGQGSRPCSQSQLARIAQPLSSPSETQKEFFSRFTEHRQQKSASNSVDFMMLSLGNLVAVPKVPQPPIHQLPNAHSLKIVGHFSDVPIESQQQSRDYNNFTRIKNVPLLHMQPPKGNGIKSRHRAHEGESYHHNCPLLYSDKHLSYQSSLNSLFF
ncbi:hypothetical protein FGO68_gene5350 [Halteria grandinella]|uniref:Uncharacterized protein n=1 Tax=Halteria grandinella TaxID=5974 RepID=A0A8J8NBT2_HALGN|nr:hypothetical protein FGO68_gene5350 [Halteria grandinella]